VKHARYPEKEQEYRIKKRYGLTVAEYNEIRSRARCDACGATDPGTAVGWHLDHNHETGAVRGLLCHGCNLALGLLKDDPERLSALLSYLMERK